MAGTQLDHRTDRQLAWTSQTGRRSLHLVHARRNARPLQFILVFFVVVVLFFVIGQRERQRRSVVRVLQVDYSVQHVRVWNVRLLRVCIVRMLRDWGARLLRVVFSYTACHI